MNSGINFRKQSSSTETLFEAANLSMRFAGLMALDSVSFSISKGEIKGIIGPNGAGKTTLFNLMTGFLVPTSGEVRYLSKVLNGNRPSMISELGIARTFQNIRLFNSFTVLENIMVGAHKKINKKFWGKLFMCGSFREKEEVLRREALLKIQFVHIEGQENTLARNLPYGDQRRVEIARALISEPSLLLLDEPVAGMTSNEREDLKKIIQEVSRNGTTIVVIEHNMKFVMDICDSIVVLNFGKKIFEGSPIETQNDMKVIEAYLGKEE